MCFIIIYSVLTYIQRVVTTALNVEYEMNMNHNLKIRQNYNENSKTGFFKYWIISVI